MAPETEARRFCIVSFAALALTVCVTASAQSLYKYRGDNGELIYSDRAPQDGKSAEVRQLTVAPAPGTVELREEIVAGELLVIAKNSLYAPVEIGMIIKALAGARSPESPDSLRWVLGARNEAVLLRLPTLGGAARPSIEYVYDYFPGVPGARHRVGESYSAPFVVAANFPISQAYPDTVTHTTAGSLYAIDIAMPVGTDVLAARDGVVFDVIGTNYSGGTNREKHLKSANIVRILHDDGTFAVYAHLSWDSIRVRPGDRVQRGQYIADSGNTGFSSGPHLHFAVQRNAGLRIESLPVTFSGPDSSDIVPATGNLLVSYR